MTTAQAERDGRGGVAGCEPTGVGLCADNGFLGSVVITELSVSL